MNERQGWALAGFEDCLDQWIDREQPPDDLRLVVTAWVFTRLDDPYLGVRREPAFDNLWFGPVPGSLHARDQVVVCSSWVVESSHLVRCDSIATLRLPL